MQAYEHVEPFQKADTLCVAIRRNLYNLIDTLKSECSCSWNTWSFVIQQSANMSGADIAS